MNVSELSENITNCLNLLENEILVYIQKSLVYRALPLEPLLTQNITALRIVQLDKELSSFFTIFPSLFVRNLIAGKQCVCQRRLPSGI